MARPRSFQRQTWDYAEFVLKAVMKAVENGPDKNGLFVGGVLFDEVRKCELMVRKYNEKVEKRASRGRY